MAAHSCEWDIPSCGIDTKSWIATGGPVSDRIPAVAEATGCVIDPDALTGHARNGRVGSCRGPAPHFASVVAGTLPRVSSDHTPASENDEPSDEILQAQFEAMQAARARLAEIPAEIVIQNHVMGLYELAAIHLGSQPPSLHEAALAIDAVGCLVEGLGERLGDDHVTLAEALSNIRLAFVQIKGAATASDAES